MESMPQPSAARRIIDLLDELDKLKAKYGGWRVNIPAEERAAWQARRDALVAELEAGCRRDRRASQPARGSAARRRVRGPAGALQGGVELRSTLESCDSRPDTFASVVARSLLRTLYALVDGQGWPCHAHGGPP
jgi:hypothetical protein